MFRDLKRFVLPYLRTRVLPSKPAQLLIQTGLKWDRDNVSGMAAALSYYSLFSLFPLLLVLLSIFGALVGPDTEAFRSIQMAIVRYLPTEVHGLIRDTVIALNSSSVGAGIIGSMLLLWASTTVFSILRQSVNRIWQTPSRASESGSVLQMVMFFVTNKLFAFLLVLGTALLMVASLVSNIVVKAIIELTTNFTETFAFLEIDELQLTSGLQVSSSVLILSLAISILFKVLPSIQLAWNDVWLGAIITAFLLVGLQQLTTNSVVSIGGRFLSYGVIGSVMILMLWIFLTCQIFLVGCEISYIYAHLFGSRRRETIT
ncbi:YihY/virulence factor BrkB family protein [Leptolyngbya iicbica]|uniref:YihY/virulence factor BrkB family protein n=2 Tax=Cyanophyceae TaxID=3028117 RepID=A0A4Q7EA03_9CYAN|nr:YihY/virulence factor BrkB family protein [Leptolyngbya sp. LK]RZM79418.1 YihY/virulence factor BrkB family protein [Leptolyngbya sp. LK]